jgi:hypothetical protein
MSKLSKLLIAVGTVAGVVLIAIALSRRGSKGPETEAQASATEPAPPAPAETSRPSFFTKRPRRQPAHPVAPGQSVEGSATATNLVSAWEDKLDEILGSTSPDADKARQMIEMFPRLPADGQEEVVQHLSNLLSDQDFGLLHAYLTNSALAENVLDVLLDDVLNRPNSLKLPALLEVARSAQHPKASEAKDFLELFLEEDYGDDWDKWQARMQEWLKDNPD